MRLAGESAEGRTRPASDGGADWRWSFESGQTTWRRPVGPWIEVERKGKRWRERIAPDEEGSPAWTEVLRDGRHYRVRESKGWLELREGANRWRVRLDVEEEARRLGCGTLEVPTSDGLHCITVYGGPSQGELERLREILAGAPDEARQRVNILYLSRDLGDLEGIAEGVELLIDRDNLDSRDRARSLLYHELGHLLDERCGRASSRAPWGSGRSVSEYGSRSALEDFAETHRVVLEQWDRLRGLDQPAWRDEDCAEKKLSILRLFGSGPSGGIW